MLRQNLRELAVSHMMDLIDGVMRRTKLMFKCNFEWGNDEAKGHQANMKAFMVKDSCNVAKTGPYKINCISKVSLWAQIWKSLQSIMNEGVDDVTSLLDTFDFGPDSCSPFIQK